MRLLDHGQRRGGLDCSFGSLAERCGDADPCNEGERKSGANE
jgi:hypothetical protein